MGSQAEMGSRAEQTRGKAGGQGGSWRTREGEAAVADQVVPHLCADKLGRTTREIDRSHNPGFQHREIKPQNL